MSDTASAERQGPPPSDWGPPGDAYWAALDEGRLTFQRCGACGNGWLPPRTECPRCWSPDWRWEKAEGTATVVSWVIYHTAFDKRFQERLPYNVAVVELDEGPRMVTNLVDLPDGQQDLIGRRVELVVQRDLGRALPRFRLSP
ncbi:Zn-ribbon domain-containing OB-fold protein [Rhodoligotrophos defluvii]|uniref:Zn-ribbon domain-containing OB-fold protein n=1 Tax=Rhodoligotrophos defluvii TaxID=2561934 RepID=UPI0010C9EE9A|nr:Zn-ribbon domain-containing OB-fold protein [Rhodoligotrophos defluvii]